MNRLGELGRGSFLLGSGPMSLLDACALYIGLYRLINERLWEEEGRESVS